MPDTPSITIIKRFTYRGQPEEWSNKYHFSGTTPVNDAAWKTLADAIIAEERKFIAPTTNFVRAYGYNAGSNFANYSVDYTVAPNTSLTGSMVMTGSQPSPGDAASCVRWWTGVRTEKGKKVYCWKYFHDARLLSGDTDTLWTTQRTLLTTFAAKIIDGTLPGSFRYCGPQGAVLETPFVLPYVTTRTLKRRGKRPPTSP